MFIIIATPENNDSAESSRGDNSKDLMELQVQQPVVVFAAVL